MKKFLKSILTILLFLGLFLLISFFRASKKDFYNNQVMDSSKSKIVYFWATWCSVCQTNLPFIKLYYTYLNGFMNSEFISFEEGTNGEKHTKDYSLKNEISFPVYMANEEILTKNFIKGYPTTLFINKDNKIIFAETGLITTPGIIIRIFLTQVYF